MASCILVGVFGIVLVVAGWYSGRVEGACVSKACTLPSKSFAIFRHKRYNSICNCTEDNMNVCSDGTCSKPCIEIYKKCDLAKNNCCPTLQYENPIVIKSTYKYPAETQCNSKQSPCKLIVVPSHCILAKFNPNSNTKSPICGRTLVVGEQCDKNGEQPLQQCMTGLTCKEKEDNFYTCQ